jgi:hypothetical protein
MAQTRKFYVDFAEEIRIKLRYCTEYEKSFLTQFVTSNLCDCLRNDNPNFKKGKFLALCNISYTEY